MSVETKLFVTCGKENLFNVVNSVVEQLNTWVRSECDSYWMGNTDAMSRMQFLFNKEYQEQAKTFTNGVTLSAYNMDVISVNFGCGDKNLRSIKICPDCSRDYSDYYSGDKIIFYVGYWGKCEEIMQQVAIAVMQYGAVYYNNKDSDDDEGFMLIGKEG